MISSQKNKLFGLIFCCLVLISFVLSPLAAQAQGYEVVTDPTADQINAAIGAELDAESTLDTGENTLTAGTSNGSFIQNTITAAKSVISALGVQALVTKGYTLDPLAWAVAKSVLNSVVQSTVKWINSGFQGSPAFVTNLNTTLLNTANSTASSFLSQLSTNGSISSPFQNAVASAISSNYNAQTNGGFFTSNPYTLNQSTSNDATFFNGNFISGGGLNTWAKAWSSTANNPFGAALLASDALNNSVTAAQSSQKTQLNWGNGFQSYKGNCNSNVSSTGTVNLSGTNNCANASILTPGSVIGNQLYKSLGSGIDQLVTANQLGEVVNALMGQLVNQVLGSGGLSGTTQPSAANGGSSYIDAISNSNTSVSSSLASSFDQTLSTQLTALQTFQTEWQTINTAALTAQTALSQSECYPDPEDEITNTVQPVLTQAETEISDAQTSIAAIQSIQTESSAAETSNSTTGIAQASSDYSAFLAATTTPSSTDIANAQQEVMDTSATPSAPQSLYSQMVALTTAAQACSTSQSPPVTTTPVTPPTGIQP